MAGASQQPEPQEGTTYELGTRSLLGNILSFDTTLFYNDYDNLITSEKDPITDETIYTNQGHTMQRGLEFSGTLFGGGLLSGLEGLSLYTAITLLDTEIKAGKNKGFLDGEVDPLSCSYRGQGMKIISLLQDPGVIRQILEHLGLWRKKTRLKQQNKSVYRPVVSEEFDNGWPGYEKAVMNVQEWSQEKETLEPVQGGHREYLPGTQV